MDLHVRSRVDARHPLRDALVSLHVRDRAPGGVVPRQLLLEPQQIWLAIINSRLTSFHIEINSV